MLLLKTESDFFSILLFEGKNSFYLPVKFHLPINCDACKLVLSTQICLAEVGVDFIVGTLRLFTALLTAKN